MVKLSHFLITNVSWDYVVFPGKQCVLMDHVMLIYDSKDVLSENSYLNILLLAPINASYVTRHE